MMDVILHKWNDVETEQLTPLITRKMVYGDRIMLSHILLKKGSVVALHHHENEQFSYVLEGIIRFYYGKETLESVDVHAGEVLFLPSNVPHSAEALEDALSLDVFSPPRQDWIDGTDSYIRKQG